MPDERRSEPRLPLDVEVQVMTTFGRSIQGRVVDTSPSGLRIRFDRPVCEGTRISLLLGSERIFALVRYCIRADNKFDAGAIIQYAIQAERISA